MGVAGHLGIELAEYDQRIRTFVPHYEALLRHTAAALELVAAEAPTVVDLGIGTGALAAACLAVRPGARVVGIDADPGMLAAARHRLGSHPDLELRVGDFLDAALPAADALVACISLHHIRDPDAKRAFYRRAFEALVPGGLFASGDCFPGAHPGLAAEHRERWLRHLEGTYTPSEARAHLTAWAEEDRYFPLGRELGWIEEAGFTTEVLWRRDGFAVVVGMRGE